MHSLDDKIYAAFLDEIFVDGPSKRNYLYGLDLYSAFLQERGLYFEEVTPGEIEAYSRLLWREHRNSVAQSAFSLVKRLYDWASENGIAPNVARNVGPRMRPTPYCRQGVSVSQAEAILAAAGTGRDAVLTNLMVREAVKTGDLAGIRMRDIIVEPEGGEMRLKDGTWIPLTAKCSQVLGGYMDSMGKSASFPNEPLLPSRSWRSWGEPLSQRSIRETVSEICRRAGISKAAGEYNIGAAALELALTENEPVEVVLSISDRTWAYRMSGLKRDRTRF